MRCTRESDVRGAYARPNAAIVRRNIILNMKLSRPVLIEQTAAHPRNNAARSAHNICRCERLASVLS
jgi:hypothetical protein